MEEAPAAAEAPAAEAQMDCSTSEALEAFALGVCDRMQALFNWYMDRFSSLLDDLKMEEQTDGTERGFDDKHIATMLAIEALARLFNYAMGGFTQIDRPRYAKFIESTLPECIYRGHINSDGDWKTLLLDRPLVILPPNRSTKTAFAGLRLFVNRLLAHREDLIHFRVDGVKCIMAIITPGGTHDDIAKEVLKIAPLPEEAATFALSVSGLAFYLDSCIHYGTVGVVAEKNLASYQKEAAVKRAATDVTNDPKYKAALEELTGLMADEVNLNNPGLIKKGERRRKAKQRKDE